jgi:hypothetical protein
MNRIEAGIRSSRQRGMAARCPAYPEKEVAE